MTTVGYRISIAGYLPTERSPVRKARGGSHRVGEDAAGALARVMINRLRAREFPQVAFQAAVLEMNASMAQGRYRGPAIEGRHDR